VRTIFTLASGRSSTRFLHDLIARNARDCVSKHEPYVSSPSMFGPAVYAYARGDTSTLRKLVARKRRCIERYAPQAYVETSHAFLKSWFALAPEYFPDLRTVHLVRNPLQVAKSFVNREAFLRRYRFPLTHYRADGQRYFYWSLTGLEPIFGHFAGQRLSRFQWYLLEWIEIENRAARFAMQSAHPPVHLRVPEDINDPAQLRALFDRLGLRMRAPDLDLSGFKNATPGAPTVVDARDREEAAAVLQQLPETYLEVFRSAPYSSCSWSTLLTTPSELARSAPIESPAQRSSSSWTSKSSVALGGITPPAPRAP
jgi:hypothetical protein